MLYEPEWDVHWIDSWNDAKDAIDELLSCSTVAVDTETAGWQFGSNRLCVVQFSAEPIKKNYLFDALNLLELDSLFKPLIENKQVLKVAHNVSFELKVFETIGLSLANYACTLEMAKQLRPHLSSFRLSALAEHFFSRSLDKSWQVSDWSQRPLLPEQIRYAASDAEVTYKIYKVLKNIATRLRSALTDDIDSLLRNYAEVCRKKEELLKPIFDTLCDYDYLLEAIKEKVRQELPKYNNEYENESCYARLQEVRKTEVSIELLKEKYPEIAELVIEPYVRRDKLKAVFKEFNLGQSDLDKVIIDVGKTYRLHLEIKD
ncbi:MAG: hypothetical protein NZT61_00195 [Deltaproteobacteria bacterium]|nr:hypothetical protein [Deltaproteobacteria bacterium]MCX7952858.1 hypothetical protein [Deltaproteobacteria bacterium]